MKILILICAEGNIKPNADGEGTLFIDEAVFANSDNYTCTVEYINPDTGQRRQEEFLHTISGREYCIYVR